MSQDRVQIGTGMNATTTIRASIFSEKVEERIAVAFERLVDHITTSPDQAAWLAKYDVTERDALLARVTKLEKELAEANAKISRRF